MLAWSENTFSLAQFQHLRPDVWLHLLRRLPRPASGVDGLGVEVLGVGSGVGRKKTERDKGNNKQAGNRKSEKTKTERKGKNKQLNTLRSASPCHCDSLLIFPLSCGGCPPLLLTHSLAAVRLHPSLPVLVRPRSAPCFPLGYGSGIGTARCRPDNSEQRNRKKQKDKKGNLFFEKDHK